MLKRKRGTYQSRAAGNSGSVGVCASMSLAVLGLLLSRSVAWLGELGPVSPPCGNLGRRIM